LCECEAKAFFAGDGVPAIMWSPVASGTGARAWKRGMVVATVGVVVTIVLPGSWTTPPSFNGFVIAVGIVSAFVVSLFVIVLAVVPRSACASCGRRVQSDFLQCPYCGTRLK